MQIHDWFTGIDHLVLICFAPLAALLLLSGLDDLVIDLAWAANWIKIKLRPRASLFPPGIRQLDSAPRKRIAIVIPLWNEHAVIERILEHAAASIRYQPYHIFAGAYPNDSLTQDAVRAAAARLPNVHLVLCPHDGPTSKADCLNWIYQHLAFFEEESGERFDVVVTHDAEDMIHPDELRWINFYCARYAFIQTPVLAIGTGLFELTHGIYCDEFAEYHQRDMVVRPLLGGFLPSSGVGTAYRRDALERLAASSANQIFDPQALTEDYENGLKLFRLGCSQAFVPVSIASGDPCATREYFPQSWGAARRQRTRWVMGIALQGWQWHGWRGAVGEVYWFWRDRKGLVANPLSLAANLVFVYGLATAIWARTTPLDAHIALATAVLQIERILVRMLCVRRIYGTIFALGVPFRAIYANALNSAATFHAVARYTWARAHHRPLKWLKTDHAFPTRAALLSHKRHLGEILVSLGHLAMPQLNAALATLRPDLRLGEHLVRSGWLGEDAVYEGLSLQQGLPVTDLRDVPRRIARALPEQALRRWRVLPFQVAEGSLFLASPDLPTAEMTSALREFTSLQLRFHLIPPSKFTSLQESALTPA